ncbi:MAG: DUF1553 domain-containing protein, partial [Isosphaeraceae bacterium]
MRRRPELSTGLALLLAILGPPTMGTLAEEPRNATSRVDYDRQIRPILADKCYACHGPDAEVREGGFRLDVREQAVGPADSGNPPIVPGDVQASTLVKRIMSKRKGLVMPPPSTNKPLTDPEKRLLSDWIAQGAAYQEHWAFQTPVRPASPEVNTAEWCRNPIDRFLLARMEERGIRPSPEADRATLIRRLTLDLTGLPPSPNEVDAYLADEKPGAYERLVDRLLASPRFGERMAQDWLDAARYADTHGYHIDSGRDMTRWRDWVIEAYNSNLPFDRFTVEQIAGDLLPNATLEQKIASGFNRNHMITFEGGAIPEEYHTAYVVDRVNTTGTVWLGLTIGCTQCHDHKFDPITQRDFYQFYAFFNNVPEKGLDGSKGNAVPFIKAPTPEQQAELDHLNAEAAGLLATLDEADPAADQAQADLERSLTTSDAKERSDWPKEVVEALAVAAESRTEAQKGEIRRYFRGRVWPSGKETQARLDATRQRLAELERRIPTAMVMSEMSASRDTFMLIRGAYDKKGEKVEPGVPAFLPPLPDGVKPDRLALARWLVDPANPLVARVTVNRLWQSIFGTGIVLTAEDFGSQGEPPSHPRLLDWLALEFVSPESPAETAWDVKRLLKLMVTSAAYRQTSAASPALLALDPEDRLLARGPRYRLSAETIRDQALYVSGLLNGEIGGRSVSPYQPPGLWEELMSRADGKNWTAQTYVQSEGRDLYRRTMYTFWKRTSPPPSLSTFDAPDRETCTVRRARTNTPLQALVLMNDPTHVEASRALAERVIHDRPDVKDEDGRIEWTYRLAVGRAPRAEERTVLREVYQANLVRFQERPADARALLAVGDSARDATIDAAEHAAWTT